MVKNTFLWLQNDCDFTDVGEKRRCLPSCVGFCVWECFFVPVCVFIYLLPAREKGVCKLSSDNKNTLTSDADIILSQNKPLEI